ncbi:MAG: 3'-5' exoribonuclease [Clostridia bacterium]|jgi:DNA polymerase-3 subunit alpha (Gram-positive type)|nr:3'-5' exoribonuclease [Clostridia bacterium]
MNLHVLKNLVNIHKADVKHSHKKKIVEKHHREFVSLDLETTGFNPKYAKIIEIGAIRFVDEIPVETFQSLINPRIPIPKKITEITGITNDMVINAPTIEIVFPQFIAFLKDSPIVAHNSSFDMGFIQHTAQSFAIRICNPIIDTLQISRIMFPNLDNHKLNTVSDYLQIKLENHHRSMSDSAAAAEIYIKCLKMLS